MTRAIRAAAAALATAVLLSTAAGAQETTPAGSGFRAETEPDLLGRRGRAIVGWLYNDGASGVGNVRLRVEVLDGGGQTVASGEAYVYGNVPAHGRAYFFVPVPSYGDRYRVTVLRYDRLEMQ
jgi:hypothetical protein